MSFEQRRQEFVSSLFPENQEKYNSYEKRKETEARIYEERISLLKTISKLEEPMTEEELQNENNVQEFFAKIKNKLNEYERTQKEKISKKPETVVTKKIEGQESGYKKPKTNEKTMEQMVNDIMGEMIKDIKAERKMNRSSSRVSGTSMKDILNSQEFKNMWKDSEQEER